MKTPIFDTYSQKLIDLNDQLCFFLFNREEMNQKLQNFTAAANPLFTTDLFSQNIYAQKIHVTFEKLPEFQSRNQTLNFGAYFSFTYEFLSGYIDDIIKLFIEHNGIVFSESEMKKDVEKRLKLLIDKIGATAPSLEYFDTISYFRLRRNYFTHVLKELNSKFIHIVQIKGASLNSFWSNSIQELDFTNDSVDAFLENETIELIKIQRIILEEIDQILAPLLSKKAVAKCICENLYSKNPTRINLLIINQRKVTVKSYARQYLGVILTDNDIEEFATTIGRR